MNQDLNQAPAQEHGRARARVVSYIQRRKQATGIDVESIHGFDVGPEGGFDLRLSDLEALLSDEQQAQHDNAILERGIQLGIYREQQRVAAKAAQAAMLDGKAQAFAKPEGADAAASKVQPKHSALTDAMLLAALRAWSPTLWQNGLDGFADQSITREQMSADRRRMEAALLAALSVQSPAPAPETWRPASEPLQYLTRGSDGTTFLNHAKLPAHAVEWAIATQAPAVAPLSEAQRWEIARSWRGYEADGPLTHYCIAKAEAAHGITAAQPPVQSM